jgi:hypothetical protein
VPGGPHPVDPLLEDLIETLASMGPGFLRVVGSHQHKTRTRPRAGHRTGFLQQRAHDFSSNFPD